LTGIENTLTKGRIIAISDSANLGRVYLRDAIRRYKQMRFVTSFSISSAPQTIKRAERLLALSEEHEEDSDPLLGCSILLLTTALDQVLNTTLKRLRIEYDAEGNEALSDRATSLQDKGLWQRLRDTPEILHSIPFKLNPKSEYVGFLRDLVQRRNCLVHIEEEPISFEIDIPPADSFPTKTLNIQLPHEQSVEYRSVLEANTWKQVTSAEVRRGIRAVSIYVDALGEKDHAEVHLLENATT
jgi:hypothetical protein